MTPEEQALGSVLEILTRLSIPYMLTGSVAASYHGRPRSTHDADVVIDPLPAQLDALVAALDAGGFYADADGARAALAARRSFNVIEMTAACKIDLIIRRDRDFSHEEFARRRPVNLPFGRGVLMVTPEDSVLSKLEWARLTGDSERQLNDARAVVLMTPSLDRPYVERWAAVLGVSDLWRRVSAPAPDATSL